MTSPRLRLAVALGALLLATSVAHAQSWTELSVSGPGDRGNPSMVFDELRGVTVLFGGSNSTQTFEDTWEFDGVTWTQVATTGPGYRSTPGIAFDSVRGVTVLFGGVDVNGYYNDTWEWDGVAWTQVATSGPPSRTSAAMAFDPVRGVCVLFGGKRHLPFQTNFSDTWEYDGAAWTQVFASGLAHRANAGLAWDGNNERILLVGGWAVDVPPLFGTQVYNSTYAYDGANWTFTGSMPVTTTLHGMLWDSTACKNVVYGGWNALVSNHNAEYDGTSWSLVTPIATFANPRYSFGWVHDSKRGVNVRYGGRYLSGSSYSWYQDTREYIPAKAAECASLSGDVTGVSLGAGGVQTLLLDAGPAFANAYYLVAMTGSGTSPATPFGAVLVPIVPDALTTFSVFNPDVLPLSGFQGTLGPDGKGTASVTIPSGSYPTLTGLRVHTAFIALDPSTGQATFASNPEALDLLP